MFCVCGDEIKKKKKDHETKEKLEETYKIIQKTSIRSKRKEKDKRKPP